MEGVKVHRNKKFLEVSLHRYKTPFWNSRTRGNVYFPEDAASSAALLPEMTSRNHISAGFRKKMAECEWDEMFLRSEYEGPVLPWDRFRRWVTCFCVVTFDLELGQALEVS